MQDNYDVYRMCVGLYSPSLSIINFMHDCVLRA